MNNSDHISESSETIFLVKILTFFDADPGWKKFGTAIRDKHPEFATLVKSYPRDRGERATEPDRTHTPSVKVLTPKIILKGRW
jgi:hypothetical protein